jgi:hypothetical protein
MRSRRATPWPAMAAEPRVDVSLMGVATWRQANLEPASGRWAWRLWSLTVEAEPEELSVTARAWDDTGATPGCHFGIRGIRRQRPGELSPFDSRIKS